MPGSPLPSATLGLSNLGKRVPIHVRDGGDGVLGKGDWIEFVGEILPGETAHFNEYTSRNTYMLSTTATAPARMKRRPAPLAAVKPGPALPLEARLHLEQDLVLLRLSGNQGKKQELWHWVKMTQIDAEPFRQALQLADVDPSAGGAVRVRLEFRGWSQPAMRPSAETKDHVVEVSVNGVVRGRTEWNNSEQGHLLVLPDIPASELAAGQFEISIRVPPRPGQGQDSLVDVSLLNWVEIDYPRLATAPARQARLYAAGEPEAPPFRPAKGAAAGTEAVAAHAAGRGNRAEGVRRIRRRRKPLGVAQPSAAWARGRRRCAGRPPARPGASTWWARAAC